MFSRLTLAIALAGALAPAVGRADAGDDQYRVAAGHYARGNWQLACDEFQVLLRDFSGHPQAAAGEFFLAEALVQLNRLDDARTQFRAFLVSHPEHRYARQASFRVGECGFLLGDPAAQQELEAFRTSWPDDALNAYVLPYLGDLALEAGEAQQAKEQFSEGLELYPEGALQDDCRFGLARALVKLADTEEAERLFLAVAGKAASPLADDAQFQLGALQYAQGDYPAALATFEAFEKTLQESPYKARARLGRGWALFQLGQYDKAGRFFEALAKTPEVELEAKYWLALTAKAQKSWVKAAEILAVIQVDAGHELAPAIAFHAGEALLQSGDSAGAAARLDQFLAAFPTSEWADDGMLLRMQAALTLGDHAKLDSLAEQFTAQFSQSSLASEAARTRARSLSARDLHAEAAQVLEPLVVSARDAADPLDSYHLAVAYMGTDRHEDALRLLDSLAAATAGPLGMDARLARATALVSLARYDQAIVPLEECLQGQAAAPDGPQAAKCRAQLAVCFARTKQMDKARATFGDLMAKHPDDPLILPTTEQLAEAAYAAGDQQWSIELFTSLAAEGNPAESSARGLSGLAFSQRRGGQLAEAAATFERLLDRYPDDPLAPASALARGQVLEQLGQWDTALAACQLVIDKHAQSPELPQALWGAARLNDKLGQPDQAALHYERLATDFPDRPDRDSVLYEWAWLLRDLDKPAEADAVFEQLRGRYPASSHWADATYRLAERALKAKEYDRAGTLASELVAQGGDSAVLPHALYMQGQIAVARQEWDQVASPMQQVVDKYPESTLRPRAEFWIAESLYRLGRHDESSQAMATLDERFADAREKWMAMVPLRQAQSLVQLRRWSEARQVAARIADRFPDFEQQYEVDYVLGRCAATQAEFDQARDCYHKVIRSPAGEGTETAAMAQWMIGETYYHQKDFATALREFLRVEILYAYPAWQAAALLEAGKCHEQLGEWKQAALVYGRLLKEYPATDLKDEATRRLNTVREKVAANP